MDRVRVRADQMDGAWFSEDLNCQSEALRAGSRVRAGIAANLKKVAQLFHLYKKKAHVNKPDGQERLWLAHHQGNPSPQINRIKYALSASDR